MQVAIMKSNKGKEKATHDGFLYHLDKEAKDMYYWVCVNAYDAKKDAVSKETHQDKSLQRNDHHYCKRYARAHCLIFHRTSV